MISKQDTDSSPHQVADAPPERDRKPLSFTHLDSAGQARMVDVSQKTPSTRKAKAQAQVACSVAIMEALKAGEVPKGDVLAVARIAGIAAVKRVPELLPLAHVIGIHGCSLELSLNEDHILIEAEVTAHDRTGVEMEALSAVTVAALAVIDMVKGVDRAAFIRHCVIVEKSGGRSGHWSREE